VDNLVDIPWTFPNSLLPFRRKRGVRAAPWLSWRLRSRSQASLAFGPSCQREAARWTLSRAFTAAGRHGAVLHISLSLPRACRVPGTGGSLPSPGIQCQGHRWIKTHGWGSRG